jgi:hypothetical protein
MLCTATMTKRIDLIRSAEKTLAATAPLKELYEELRTYPLRLLQIVVEQHALRLSPVPDHLLRLPPYLGETAIRALVEGGFVERVDDVSRAVFAYSPTEAGLEVVASMSTTNMPRRRIYSRGRSQASD